MADSDLIKLYSTRILALASGIPHTGRLDAPDVSIKRRSPLCGSTITVDLKIEAGRVADFAQDVKACALGQAAASVVGANIIGCDLVAVRRGRDELRAMLSEGGPAPSPPFDGLMVLEPAREFKNRHASVLLAFEASVEAMETHLAQTTG